MNIRRSASICVVILLICISGRLSFAQIRGDRKEEGNVMFRWGFGVKTGEGERLTFAPITKDTVLKSGDELKMVIELKKECFVYIVYQNSIGGVELLFPYNAKQFATDYSKDKNYYIPLGRQWFTLDNNLGKETFYLVASKQRLTELETQVEKYRAAKGVVKSNLAKDVVAEIRNLKKKYKSFGTLAERPISIGGNVRGKPSSAEAQRPDVANIAIEILANNFYSKTFTIGHQ